ncbi:hypothetical protein EDB82DRAFT_517222, partial [Fusarium venenatum]|uniref:uncharacterized protein n=1 Tax=Fusarium venenatum TaxID=56646 RepID=UPI001D968D33
MIDQASPPKCCCRGVQVSSAGYVFFFQNTDHSLSLLPPNKPFHHWFTQFLSMSSFLLLLLTMVIALGLTARVLVGLALSMLGETGIVTGLGLGAHNARLGIVDPLSLVGLTRHCKVIYSLRL